MSPSDPLTRGLGSWHIWLIEDSLVLCNWNLEFSKISESIFPAAGSPFPGQLNQDRDKVFFIFKHTESIPPNGLNLELCRTSSKFHRLCFWVNPPTTIRRRTPSVLSPSTWTKQSFRRKKSDFRSLVRAGSNLPEPPVRSGWNSAVPWASLRKPAENVLVRKLYWERIYENDNPKLRVEPHPPPNQPHSMLPKAKE